jgi:MFS family permease
MLVPQESGLIQDLSPGAERGRAFGILGAILRPATAAAPVVGGLILTAFTGPDGWRSVFYVNAPIGLIGLVLATRVLPMKARGRPSAGPQRTRRRKLRLRPPPGGVVDRVVKLSHGEYEVHIIGVKWPHHVFVNQERQYGVSGRSAWTGIARQIEASSGCHARGGGRCAGVVTWLQSKVDVRTIRPVRTRRADLTPGGRCSRPLG